MTEGQIFTGEVQPWLGRGAAVSGGFGSLFQLVRPFELTIGADGGMKVVNCILQFGRATLTCSDASINFNTKGVIYAAITHGKELEMSVNKGSELPKNTVQKTYRQLYKIDDNGDIVDCRAEMPAVVAGN